MTGEIGRTSSTHVINATFSRRDNANVSAVLPDMFVSFCRVQQMIAKNRPGSENQSR
ncbi:MAG: hypothetical protein ACXV8A_02400 [Chthoniobacterales bacterium]